MAPSNRVDLVRVFINLNSSSRHFYSAMAYSGDLNAEMDLGEGTSSGNSYMNGSTSKAFTISSLKQMSWMPATKFQQDEIPYIAINIKVPPPVSFI